MPSYILTNDLGRTHTIKKTEYIKRNKRNVPNKTKELSLSEEELFETANLHPIDTGLPSTIYTTFNGKRIIKQKIPQIKVKTSIGLLLIIIEDTIKLEKNHNLNKEDQYKVNEAITYIKRHRQTFKDHWNGLITDRGLMDQLFNRKITKRSKN